MKSIDFAVYYSAEIEIRTILLSGLFYLLQNCVYNVALCCKHQSSNQLNRPSKYSPENISNPRKTHEKNFGPTDTHKKISDTRNALVKKSRTHKKYPREKNFGTAKYLRKHHGKIALNPR